MLEKAKEFLRSEVKPVAQQIDWDVDALRRVVDRMGEVGLLALKRPMAFGGPEMAEPLFRVFQEEIARTSGTLAFLTTQHQSAVGMIGNGENELLKEEYLPYMASGTKRVGIGFSQLRRSGPPIMTATRQDDGYLLTGHVPWVTGWTIFPEFLIGASLEDGRSLFAVVPFVEIQGSPESGGSVKISEPMKLAAMGAAMTVTADFDRFFVPDEKVAFIKHPGWIQNSDMINIALQGHFAIGCAMAGIDIVRENAARKPFPFLQSAVAELEAELLRLRMTTFQAQRTFDEASTPERLQARAWAIDFAVRCAHAAIAASSGAANSVNHPAQRVYREALVFTVSAQTPPIMEATLSRLVQRTPVSHPTQ